MKAVEMKKGIYWVGGIDWDLRNFHGYLTQKGSTYNAYLIIDEKITLIDTVKYYLFDEMISRISTVIDPSKIDLIVSNHVEMDHSGGIPMLLEKCPNATVITSPNGEKGLKAHFKKDWKFQVVKSGDKINIGKRNLSFALTPMVHWPDNMVCYLEEEKILFSNDAFGQHLATYERFDDEYQFDTIMEEAKKYYANIVMPFFAQAQNAVAEVSKFPQIDIIAPSHGIIWRKNIPAIIQEYKKWSNNETEEKAVIIYDTMWKSTEKIAHAIYDFLEENNIKVMLRSLQTNHISDVMTDIQTAKYIFVGSPTLNNNLLPTVAGFLTYFKALAPKKRTAMAFGSYGWGGQSVEQIDKILKEMGLETLDSIRLQYIPDPAVLKQEIQTKLAKLKK